MLPYLHNLGASHVLAQHLQRGERPLRSILPRRRRSQPDDLRRSAACRCTDVRPGLDEPADVVVRVLAHGRVAQIDDEHCHVVEARLAGLKPVVEHVDGEDDDSETACISLSRPHSGISSPPT